MSMSFGTKEGVSAILLPCEGKSVRKNDSFHAGQPEINGV